MIELTSHFGSNNRSRHSEWLRQRQWFIKAKQAHRQKDDIADKANGEFLTVASAAIVATDIQIAEFEQRLDLYEARLDAFDAQLDAQEIAITKALMENQLALDKLYSVREEMLDSAFVLPDGRRVFKSEDGVTVYDEFHAVVGSDVIEPNDIPDSFKRHEQLIGVDELISRTETGRDQLHKAMDDVDAAKDNVSALRDKLDNARSAIEDGDLTVQDIKDMDADLEASLTTALPSIPASAMKHFSGVGTANSVPKIDATFNGNANHNLARADQSFDPAFQPDQP